MIGSTEISGTGRDEVPCPDALAPNDSADPAKVVAGALSSAEMTLVKQDRPGGQVFCNGNGLGGRASRGHQLRLAPTGSLFGGRGRTGQSQAALCVA